MVKNVIQHEYTQSIFNFDNLIERILYIERSFTDVIIENLGQLFNIFYMFGISLIILKFLKKGFESYILRLGDPDTPPGELLIRMGKAIFISIAFIPLYDIMVKVIIEIVGLVMDLFASTVLDVDFLLSALVSTNLLGNFFVIVFTIGFYMIAFQFIVRGFELMMLRVGVPWACVGLLDSDDGFFAPYVKKIFQEGATMVVQIVLIQFALLLFMSTGDIFVKLLSFGAIFTAIKTPKILSEFMIASGGGGAAGKLHTTFRAVDVISTALR